MPATVIVHGLPQIQRDLAKSGPEVAAATREGLRAAAEPVSRIAEGLSLARIRRMPRSPQWAINRIGVTTSTVYMVPKQRGTRGGTDPRRRPNLVGLMMDRSYVPALEAGTPIVQRMVIDFLKGVTL